MPLLSQRVARGLLPALDASRGPALEQQPHCVVLDIKPGHTPSEKPPVRIFLGSERAQFRAERVFLWSVEKHRDPARRYEIYLLKDLAIFSRRFWLTGFTNYRFSIPYFCGYLGRAIYNDTDQIYLRDPAELFDLAMEQAGFLSINDRDTSVMLLDCERLAAVWSLSAVRRASRQALEAQARAAGLWGHLDGGWNARDKEFDPERSALIHYTTLHTQPWRPFPEHLVYFDNPVGEIWFALEREADAAGFQPVSASAPSAAWPAAQQRIEALRPGPAVLAALAAERAPGGVLQVGRGVLEAVPDADLSWVLERLFASCDELLLLLDEPLRSSPQRLRRARSYWLAQLAQAARCHPQTRWRVERKLWWKQEVWVGGPAVEGAVVVLLHGKPGHNQQALALASALAQQTGRALREIRPALGEWRWALGWRAGLELPADAAILVASGWVTSRMARYCQRRRPDLRLVLTGRKAGRVPDVGGAVVRCRHFALPPHPAALETLLPLNAARVTPCRDAGPWQAWLDAPRRVAILLGGPSKAYRLDESSLTVLVRAAQDFADRHAASLLLISSRRTAECLPALHRLRRSEDSLYVWQPDDPSNPYALALQHANAVVVTGESESMLADVLASGHRALLWPLPPQPEGLWQRFSAWVAQRAVRPTLNRRGSITPQQGLEYLCARALERAWILPPRRLEALHELIIAAGHAERFTAAAELPVARVPLQEVAEISALLIKRLQLDPSLPSRN
jgi:hypothetical protein